MRIRDEEFIRGRVPMTKEEVRTISLAKLDLSPEDHFLDIGAGTGSVSIQASQQLPKGEVFSIEVNPEALTLLAENTKKFQVNNLRIIPGMALEELHQVPRSITKVFIGGTKGQLKELVHKLGEFPFLNRILITAITLNTLQEGMKALEENQYKEIEVIQVQINRVKNIKSHFMLQAENPIFILSAAKEEKQ